MTVGSIYPPQGLNTLTNPTIQGAVSAGTGLTMPAFTAGGDINVNGKKLSNIDLSEKSFVNLLDNGDFEIGDPPTGWTYNSSIVASRNATTKKIGNYSLKLLCNGVDGKAEQYITNYARYAGRKVTLGFWYNCPATNDKWQEAELYDGVVDITTFGLIRDGTWHWKTLTFTLSASPTQLRVVFHNNWGGASDTDDVFYVDGAILVEGDSCPAFSPKPTDFYTPGALVYHSTSQSIPDCTYTILSFDSEKYDTDSIHDTVTNNSRLTCKTAGKYYIWGTVCFAGNSTGYRSMYIGLNGYDVSNFIAVVENNNIGTNNLDLHVSVVWPLAVNDYVVLIVWQNSGSPLTVYADTGSNHYTPNFGMQRIG
jgi:hypothetical protein